VYKRDSVNRDAFTAGILEDILDGLLQIVGNLDADEDAARPPTRPVSRYDSN